MILSADEIDRKGINDMEDLAYATPGMYVQEFGPGRQVIFMRGVANIVGSEALTSVYLDEVPMTSGAQNAISIGQLDLPLVFGNAVPDVLDELDALGDAEMPELNEWLHHGRKSRTEQAIPQALCADA